MVHESNLFSLVFEDDGEMSFWRANVDLKSDTDATLNLLSTNLFRLVVEDDCEMTGAEFFRVTEAPSNGSLELHAEEVSSGIETFDLDSVRRGEVVYRRRTLDGSDQFSFEMPSAQVVGRLKLMLIRSSMELHLKQCAKAEVPVGGTVSLGKDLLEATSPTDSPDEVLYTASRPRHGHLIFKSQSDAAVEVTSFSQTMLNNGQIIYQHSGEVPGLDHFRFNVVSRDGTTIGERMFRIKIVGS